MPRTPQTRFATFQRCCRSLLLAAVAASVGAISVAGAGGTSRRVHAEPAPALSVPPEVSLKPTPTPTAQTGAYLGVWQPDLTATNSLTTVQQFEADAGRHMAIVHFWMDWNPQDKGTLNPNWLTMIDQHGSVPMITWSPADWTGGSQANYTSSAIASGADDAYIRSFAQTLKNFGKPVLLRTMHEMNGSWYPNWCCNPATFIAAWQHIHDLFTSVGASNVQWIWCPNYWVTAWGDTAPLAYYPGDAYVDWVAVDGFNNATPNWVSFGQLFTEDYTTLTSTYPTKPLMIAEFASTEPTAAQVAAGDSKAKWFTQTFSAVRSSFPKIRALVYFNEDKTVAESCNCDWPIESDSAAQQAYKRAIAPGWFLSTYP